MTRVLLLTVALIAASPARGADLVQTRGSSSLTIQFPSQTPTIALADTITVTLRIEGSSAVRVQAPLDLPRGAKWQLVERSKPTREPIDNGRVRWRIVYRFAPREPGSLPFAFPEVKFRDRDDRDQSVAWDPVAFMVKTQITTLDRAAIRGVADIEHLPSVPSACETWPIWAGLATAVAILIGVAFGWLRWLRRRMRKTPAARALCELDRLVAADLPGFGRSERFVTLLSLLLRRYLDKQFHLLARRQTTPEFLLHLDAEGEFSVEEKQFLATFLLQCDAVKFAGTQMTTDECRHWADATAHFLRKRCGEVAQAG